MIYVHDASKPGKEKSSDTPKSVGAVVKTLLGRGLNTTVYL